MPYIEPAFRDRLDQGDRPVNTGELNYLLTKALLVGACPGTSPTDLTQTLYAICYRYLPESPRYGHYNDVVGALVCCVHEFRRRARGDGGIAKAALDGVLQTLWVQIDAYEEKKRKQNGDV